MFFVMYRPQQMLFGLKTKDMVALPVNAYEIKLLEKKTFGFVDRYKIPERLHIYCKTHE